MNHNQRLDQLFAQMQHKLSQASTEEDCLEIIRMATKHKGSFQYDFKISIAIFVIALLILVSLAASHQAQPIILLILLLAIFIIFASRIHYKANKGTNILKKLYTIDASFDYGMHLIPTPNIQQLAKIYHKSEFQRGNYSNIFKYYYKGKHHLNNDTEVHYFPYHYHYVNMKRHRDKNGKVKKSYTHHDKYGVFIDFDIGFSMDIISSYNFNSHLSYKYKTASSVFSSQYKIYTSNEFKAAKFFTPQMIILFEEFHKQFPNANIRFRKNKNLCISLTGNLLYLPRLINDNTWENLDILYKEIESKTDFSELNKILAFIKQIKSL